MSARDSLADLAVHQKKMVRQAASVKSRRTEHQTAESASNMSAAAQRSRGIDALRAGPQTTYSLRARGISHPAMRVKELLNRGYPIFSERVTAVDSDGYMHNGVALYKLLADSHQPDLFGGN